MVEKNMAPSELEELLTGNPYLKQIFQNMTQVIWVLDLSTDQIVYISPAFETVWGRSCESFYADPLTLIQSVHPEDRVIVMAVSPDDQRKSLHQTYRIVRPDDSLRWISAQVFLIQKEAASTAYQICVAEDITDQNRVDQTLRKALDRSREQFTLSRRMSVARKPEVVLKTLMSTSELRGASRAFVLFFEAAPGDLPHGIEVITDWLPSPNLVSPHPYETLHEAGLFEELALLDLFHPARPVMVSEILKDQRLKPEVRALLLEEQVQTVAIFPLVAIGKWLGCLLVFFAHERHFEPVELRHIKVLVDQAAITFYNLQLLEIEGELRHEAERASEIKTQFLAMISHELRTPLTSIVGFANTLLAEDVSWEPAEQHDFILTIRREGERLQELIDHLLVLSRLEAGMLPISKEPDTLQNIIKDALPQLQTLTSGHRLTLHFPADLPPISVDAKRIAQVLVNLVRNAAAYAPKGTKIAISASARGDFMQINVSDQGPGIPPSEHKRAFKAFRRSEQVEKGASQGAGLGLAICKGLVEAHGGQIWIKKKNTPGASISFTVPLLLTAGTPIEPTKAEESWAIF